MTESLSGVRTEPRTEAGRALVAFEEALGEAGLDAERAATERFGRHWEVRDAVLEIEREAAALPSEDARQEEADDFEDIDGPRCWTCGKPCGHVYATPIERPGLPSEDALAGALHDTDPLHQNPGKDGRLEACPDNTEYRTWAAAILARLRGGPG